MGTSPHAEPPRPPRVGLRDGEHGATEGLRPVARGVPAPVRGIEPASSANRPVRPGGSQPVRAADGGRDGAADRRPAIHPHPVREGVRLLGLLRDAAGVPAAPDRGRAVISGPDSRASRQAGGGGRGRSVRHPARVRRRVGGGSRPSQGGHRRRCAARSGSHDGRREGDLRHRAAQGVSGRRVPGVRPHQARVPVPPAGLGRRHAAPAGGGHR